ncbi:MAG: hypothetical protein P4L46_15515 [Fimbriimonas sp.]|nr:hypothetical protein [Fimbriimonas sp.]
MAQRKIYEGTLEEITALYGFELRGRHLQVLVDEGPVVAGYPTVRASSAEWAKALSEWAAGHTSNANCLSDEAVSRDSIYEGRG